MKTQFILTELLKQTKKRVSKKKFKQLTTMEPAKDSNLCNFFQIYLVGYRQVKLMSK